MKHLKRAFVACILLEIFTLAFTQTETKSYTHPKGFTVELPEGLWVEMGESYLSFKGSIELVAVVQGGIDLIEKSTFKSTHYGIYLRNGVKFEKLPLRMNEELVGRIGTPAVYYEKINSKNCMFEMYVEFDEDHLLGFKAYPWRAVYWNAVEPEIKKMLASIRISKPQNYAPNKEDEELFDPPILTEAALPDVQGPLRGKVSHHSFALSTPLDLGGLDHYPLQTAALPDGGFVVAWMDSSGHTHLQRFDKRMAATGLAKVLKNTGLGTLTGDSKGFAGIFYRKQVKGYNDPYADSYLLGYTPGFELRFKTHILGDEDMIEVGDQRVDNEYGNNNLLFVDGTYALYLSTMKHWNDGVTHQGDYLIFYDLDGKEIKGKYGRREGWTWGASHSFSKALCHDGTDFNMVACGDGHPRGLAYTRYVLGSRDNDYGVTRKNVMPIPGQAGNNDAKVNKVGAIQANDKWALTAFVTPSHGKKYPGKVYTHPKLHLLRVDKKGNSGRPVMVNPDPRKSESGHKLIPYGKGFLLLYSDFNPEGLGSWQTWRDRYQLLNADGQKLGQAYELPTWFTMEIPKSEKYLGYQHNDYSGASPVLLANGDVLWVRQLLVDEKLEFVRIKK